MNKAAEQTAEESKRRGWKRSLWHTHIVCKVQVLPRWAEKRVHTTAAFLLVAALGLEAPFRRREAQLHRVIHCFNYACAWETPS
jgi:hypothetical protein